MTTLNVSSVVTEKPLVMGANSVGYSRKKILIPNIPTQAGDTVTSVTVDSEGSGYSSAPSVSFSSVSGSGAAATAVLGFAISSVNNITPGDYASMPTFGATVGSGASLVGHMGANTISLVTAQSGSGNYVPGDQIQLTGGTFTQPIVVSVLNTQVVSATINSGGSGGTNGTQIVTGTTGTGTKFQASVTISGGAIIDINLITVGGIYTTNPTNLNIEPVTGAGLSGATLSIKMGVNQIDPTYNNIGDYTVLPTAPISQGSTTGTGTGAQFNVNSWGIVGVGVTAGGTHYDNTSALTITGGGGTGGGSGHLVLASTGGVKAVNLTNGGADYSTPPSVSFTGGGGSGAAATAVINGTNDPITVSLNFSSALPTNNYAIKALPSQAAVASYANKTVNGADIILTPLDGTALVTGSMDAVIEFTS